jgi:hypothetical protein
LDTSGGYEAVLSDATKNIESDLSAQNHLNEKLREQKKIIDLKIDISRPAEAYNSNSGDIDSLYESGTANN